MRIFVAGPWGDYRDENRETVTRNIATADRVGQRFVRAGHEVYIPHTMCSTWTGKFTKGEMERLDNSFLEHWAEAIYRIPGNSPGADAEVAKARVLGLMIMEKGA